LRRNGRLTVIWELEEQSWLLQPPTAIDIESAA